MHEKKATIYLQPRKRPSTFPFQTLPPRLSNPEAFDLKLPLTRENFDDDVTHELAVPARESLGSAPSTTVARVVGSKISKPERFYRAAMSVL